MFDIILSLTFALMSVFILMCIAYGCGYKTAKNKKFAEVGTVNALVQDAVSRTPTRQQKTAPVGRQDEFWSVCVNGRAFYFSPSHEPKRIGEMDIFFVRPNRSRQNYDIAMAIVGGYLWFERQSGDIYRLKGFFETLPPKEEKLIALFDSAGLFLADNTRKVDFSFQRQLLDEVKSEPV